MTSAPIASLEVYVLTTHNRVGKVAGVFATAKDAALARAGKAVPPDYQIETWSVAPQGHQASVRQA